MLWLLGIDGGGSKTEFMTARLGGMNPASRLRVEAGSSRTRSPEPAVAAVLERGCRESLAREGGSLAEVAAVCGGFASAGAHAAWYEATLRRLLPQARVRVMTDAELAWHGATGGQDGLVVVAGTGSVVWGRYQGREARAGGEGPGRDPGSGDQIGRDAVAAGLAAAPADSNYAGLLPDLTGSEAILRHAAAELAAMVWRCARELAWSEPDVYYWGGVFEAAPAMRAYLSAAGGFALREVRQPPAMAALALAQQLVG